MPLLFLFSEYFTLLAGGMVPRYQPCICVLVAFSVNYWQSTNSYEVVFSYGCIFSSPLGLTFQPVGLLAKKRSSERFLYQRDAFLGSSVHGWALNRGCRRGSRVELNCSTGGRRLNLFPILLMTDFFFLSVDCFLHPFLLLWKYH